MKKYLSVTLIVVIIGISFSSAKAADFLSLDQAPAEGVSDLAPVFDFDGDGCYPAAGISRLGEKNPGLNTSGSLGGGCRTSNFLEYSNTLHRRKCISDSNGVRYCGNFFAMYFEKDQVIPGYDPFGHRHDWEQVAVWTRNGIITHGSVSAHGDMETRAIGNLPRQGNHIKVVYHKDGVTTHAFRFAKSNESAENSYGHFVTPPIISWMFMKGDGVSNAELRNKLNTYNYGSATIPLKDSNFLTNLNRFKPSSYPHFFSGEDSVFTHWFSEEGNGSAICPEHRVVSGIECRGRYCDNKRLKCTNVPGVIPTGSSWESSRFSEEQPNYAGKYGEQVLVGLKCNGRYCDNLTAIFKQQGGSSNHWTNYFSEEQGLGQCAIGSFVAGLQCSGRYCDNLSLRCRQPL
ncbi:NPP1 family protein [Pleionea sediminis]|uniref:NPP1 family protein n=1 Tax=Pleionea sediminis TaxID=2569479 RepID=UPI001185F5BD|nr:NPP1 family protein [Pleionea sediminis]